MIKDVMGTPRSSSSTWKIEDMEYKKVTQIIVSLKQKVFI